MMNEKLEKETKDDGERYGNCSNNVTIITEKGELKAIWNRAQAG